MAETELIADYSQSPVVFGDANSNFAAGRRLPDTITVERPGMQPHKLHALAHRAGHALLLLAGPAAHIPSLVELHAGLQRNAADSSLFEAAVCLGAHLDLPGSLGHLDPAATNLLGIAGTTLLAVRPDGYIGLRADKDHLNAIKRYHALVCAGCPS